MRTLSAVAKRLVWFAELRHQAYTLASDVQTLKVTCMSNRHELIGLQCVIQGVYSRRVHVHCTSGVFLSVIPTHITTSTCRGLSVSSGLHTHDQWCSVKRMLISATRLNNLVPSWFTNGLSNVIVILSGEVGAILVNYLRYCIIELPGVGHCVNRR